MIELLHAIPDWAFPIIWGAMAIPLGLWLDPGSEVER